MSGSTSEGGADKEQQETTRGKKKESAGEIISKYICTRCPAGAVPFVRMSRLEKHVREDHPSATGVLYEEIKELRGLHRCTICKMTWETATGHMGHYNKKHNSAGRDNKLRRQAANLVKKNAPIVYLTNTDPRKLLDVADDGEEEEEQEEEEQEEEADTSFPPMSIQNGISGKRRVPDMAQARASQTPPALVAVAKKRFVAEPDPAELSPILRDKLIEELDALAAGASRMVSRVAQMQNLLAGNNGKQ